MPEAILDSLPTTALLRAVLNVSLTAIQLLRPRYATAGGELTDFALDYLNPAAQRLAGLAEQPGVTLQAAAPAAFTNGVFAFYRRVFETGEAGRYDYHYPAGGLTYHGQVAAERQGEHLVVSFTATAEHPRTAAEEALRASQAREQAARAEAERQRGELQRVFEQAPVAIAVYRGPNYTIELANATVARLWDRTREQLLGKGVYEALPEAAGLGYEELMDGVMATGVPYVARGMESRHMRHGQLETVYWDFVYVPLREADDHVTGVMVVATEVTEQVRARQQLQQLNEELELRVMARSAETRAALAEAEAQREQARQQQALLGQILGQVPAAIATLSGPAHRFSFFNAPYQALVAGRAALGCPVAEVLGEVEEQGFIALLDQVYTTGQPFIGTDTPIMLQRQGSGPAKQQYLDFTYQPLVDGQQQTQGILAFVVDVTEKVRARKQAETLQAAMLAVVQRQGQERENVYQLFEQAPAAICLLREPDHRIDYLNPAYQALFPGRALRGRTLAEGQPGSAALVTLLDGIYQGGERQQQREVPVPIPQPDGQPPHTRYFDFTYQAYHEAGRIAGVSIFGFDVTERVEANQAVRDANARLVRTNADLDMFVYTASHDLKAPIANIEGLLEALRGDLPAEVLAGPPVSRLLAMMQGAVGRFQQTLGHLTHIAQLQQPEDITKVNLADLIEDVQLDLAPLIEAAPATLTVDVVGCHAVRVAPKTLRSVVYNLLSNAVKYRAPHRPAQVQLRARCVPNHLVLAVQDNGLGLTAAQQAELFGMFKRLHTHVEGSGVGLFMVKRLVENAGGTITVQSQVEVGTTFSVSLPA